MTSGWEGIGARGRPEWRGMPDRIVRSAESRKRRGIAATIGGMRSRGGCLSRRRCCLGDSGSSRNIREDVRTKPCAGIPAGLFEQGPRRIAKADAAHVMRLPLQRPIAMGSRRPSPEGGRLPIGVPRPEISRRPSWSAIPARPCRPGQSPVSASSCPAASLPLPLPPMQS